jgi:hypothetical protein
MRAQNPVQRGRVGDRAGDGEVVDPSDVRGSVGRPDVLLGRCDGRQGDQDECREGIAKEARAIRKTAEMALRRGTRNAGRMIFSLSSVPVSVRKGLHVRAGAEISPTLVGLQRARHRVSRRLKLSLW